MKSKKIQIASNLLILFIILLSYSCATIVSKSNYPLMVNSTPTDARVTITNNKGVAVYTGITPAAVSLKSGGGFFTPGKYQILFEKAGYDPKTVEVKMTFDGWYVGNLLFGGFLGLLIVDPATGAMWKLDITQINERLFESSAFNFDSSIQIYDFTQIPDEWKEKLVPIE